MSTFKGQTFWNVLLGYPCSRLTVLVYSFVFSSIPFGLLQLLSKTGDGPIKMILDWTSFLLSLMELVSPFLSLRFCEYEKKTSWVSKTSSHLLGASIYFTAAARTIDFS